MLASAVRRGAHRAPHRHSLHRVGQLRLRPRHGRRRATNIRPPRRLPADAPPEAVNAIFAPLIEQRARAAGRRKASRGDCDALRLVGRPALPPPGARGDDAGTRGDAARRGRACQRLVDDFEAPLRAQVRQGLGLSRGRHRDDHVPADGARPDAAAEPAEGGGGRQPIAVAAQDRAAADLRRGEGRAGRGRHLRFHAARARQPACPVRRSSTRRSPRSPSSRGRARRMDGYRNIVLEMEG